MENALYEVLKSRRWGTISPKSIEATNAICKHMNSQYGICLHSLSAALEALLRSLDIGYGDEVIVFSYGNPINSMVTAAIGAMPVFADIDFDSCSISVDSVCENITERTKAIIVDSYAGLCGDLKELSQICKVKGIYLIQNMGDEFVAQNEKYAAAIILDVGSNYSLTVGLGGAILTDDNDIYQAAFAYHNCGRVPGEVNNLKVENFIGGNMRIAEWQACLVEDNIKTYDSNINEKMNNIVRELSCAYLSPIRSIGDRVLFVYNEESNNGVSKHEYIDMLNKEGINAKQQYVAMHKEPFFYSDYFKKLTGCDKPNLKGDLRNSLLAEDKLIWVYC